MNPKHNELLQARLDEAIIKALLQEDHPMYSPELQAALQKAGVRGSVPKPKEKGKKRNNLDGGPRSRKQKKAAPAPIVEEGEPEDPEAVDGDDDDEDLSNDGDHLEG